MRRVNLEEPESMEQPMISQHGGIGVSSLSSLDFDSYLLMKHSPIKTLYIPILSILTCFIIWIPILKSDRFKKLLLFHQVETLFEATHIYIQQNSNFYILKLQHKHQLIVFELKKVLYYFENETPHRFRFQPSNSLYFTDQRESFKDRGLSEQEQSMQRQRYGRCEHIFEVPGLGLFLLDTLTGPFFILQYFTCLVYIWEKFYVFSVIMLATSLITTFINYYLLRRSVLKIKESTEKYTKVEVLCNGQFLERDSQEIVPGDIIRPPKDMPCDALLIQGGVFANEATLTGESLPIQKIPIQSINQLGNEKNWLYQGSIIVEQRGNPLALVIDTGFNTKKGESFRTMLDQDYEQPRFVRSGFLFMLQLLILCCAVFAVMIPIMIFKKLQSQLIIMRFLDMLGWAIPPTFPIFFNICYSFTLYRLEKRKIFATEPTKTVTAGKLKNIYFDKTGTLTLNQIEFTKVAAFEQSGEVREFEFKSQSIDPAQLRTKIFSSCHSARVIEGELMGDEVDIRMFEKSGYSFEVPDDTKIKAIYRCGDHLIEAIRINQYESQNRSMSVLVRDSATNQHYVFVKGSPEKLGECSTNQIPDYHNIIFKMSLEGLRLIAFGYKKVSNYEQYLTKDIKDFESDLVLVGLMGFSNELRPQSEETITLLHESGINVAMITGDNIWTGIEAAARTGILNSQQQVLVIEGNKQQNKQKQSITLYGSILRIQSPISQSEEGSGNLCHQEGKERKTHQLEDTSLSFEEFHSYQYSIAVDSNFLNLYPHLINSNIKVFARSKPETKLHIITTVQDRFQKEWEERPFWKRLVSRTPYAVGMVGDGANDVMAIKGANVGIGINDCDSSFASDYSIDKLTDVEYVVRSGKTTLSIVLDMFRYYGSISILKFTTTCIMSLDRANYSDNQFTYFNYMQSIEIVVLMSLTLPTRENTVYYPNDNLLSIENHLIFHGMILLPTIALIAIYFIVSHMPGYVLNPEQQYSSWEFRCMTNTVLSLASQCFYVANAFLIYTSWPWKQEIWKNKVLIAWLIASGVSLTIYFFITEKLDAFFGYVHLPQMVLLVTIAVVFGFIVIEYLWRRAIGAMRLENSE